LFHFGIENKNKNTNVCARNPILVKFLTTISEAEVKKHFRRLIVGTKILYLRNKLTY